MLADINTKPLQGELFREMRAAVQNCPVDLPPEGASENPALAVCNAIMTHLSRLQGCVGEVEMKRDGE